MPRRAKPWFRSAENVWYATHNGRKVRLGVRGQQNEAAAWRAWELLRAEPSPRVTPPPITAPAPAVPPPAVPAVPDHPVGAGAPVTVSDVIAAFLEDADGRVTAGTMELYRLYLGGFVKKHGTLPASSLTCPLAEAYSRRPTWNGSTRSVFLATLARAFYHAERARLIDRTPLIGLRKPPIASRAADAMVTGEEHAKLSAASPPSFRTFLQMLYFTGCRPAEAAQLTAADIDWEAATAVIRKHKTMRKGHRRVLYLAPTAVTMLRELATRYPTGPLFRNRIGKPWARATIGAAMRKASRTAGLPGKIAYGYRHGFATDALASGVPDAQVAELLGHSSTAMLHKHYAHLGTKTKVMAEALRRVR